MDSEQIAGAMLLLGLLGGLVVGIAGGVVHDATKSEQESGPQAVQESFTCGDQTGTGRGGQPHGPDAKGRHEGSVPGPSPLDKSAKRC
jgi:hypothetical protein